MKRRSQPRRDDRHSGNAAPTRWSAPKALKLDEPPDQPRAGAAKRRKKAARPWIVESRWRLLLFGWVPRPEWGPWVVHGRYRNERERDQALRQLVSGHRYIESHVQFRSGGTP